MLATVRNLFNILKKNFDDPQCFADNLNLKIFTGDKIYTQAWVAIQGFIYMLATVRNLLQQIIAKPHLPRKGSLQSKLVLVETDARKVDAQAEARKIEDIV